MYKFGLYFSSSCTTAENPLCAALNNGVAPSYNKCERKIFQIRFSENTDNSHYLVFYLHNGQRQRVRHFSTRPEQCDHDPSDWRSTKERRHQYGTRLHLLPPSIKSTTLNDVHFAMQWISVLLYPTNFNKPDTKFNFWHANISEFLMRLFWIHLRFID